MILLLCWHWRREYANNSVAFLFFVSFIRCTRQNVRSHLHVRRVPGTRAPFPEFFRFRYGLTITFARLVVTAFAATDRNHKPHRRHCDPSRGHPKQRDTITTAKTIRLTSKTSRPRGLGDGHGDGRVSPGLLTPCRVLFWSPVGGVVIHARARASPAAVGHADVRLRAKRLR